MCVSPIMRAYSWSSAYLYIMWSGFLCSACAPTCTWLYRIMLLGKSHEKNPVKYMEAYVGQGFSEECD